MRAEVVSIGSELLLGQIVDTNAAFIARQLAAIGLDLFRKVTVGDNLVRVAEVLGAALGRAEVVITTGGLGPTADDVTREAVAHVTGRSLVFHPDLMAQIETFFAARGLPAPASNRKQALIPEGAIPVPNPVGTAPCFIVEQGERVLASLPGVPREMEHLLRERILPYLRERYRLSDVIVSRLVRVAGLGESRVGELLGDFMATASNPTVGTMAHLGQVDVRIAAKAAGEAAARALIAPVEAQVRARLGDVVFGVDDETLEGIVAAGLAARGLTLTLLEVGTGGLVAERLTEVPAAASRVVALVAPDATVAARLGATDPDGDLGRAARAFGRTDVGAAVVLGAPEGGGPSRVYPVRIRVATAVASTGRDDRVGGDLRQVRVRAQVATLDGIRRAILASEPSQA